MRRLEVGATQAAREASWPGVGRGRGLGAGRGSSRGYKSGRGSGGKGLPESRGCGGSPGDASSSSETLPPKGSSDTDVSLQRRRIRDEVLEGIRIVLGENTTLQSRDFDGHVLQFLHAIHGVGGRDCVNGALVMIHQSTFEKSRGQVGNWPAYLVTLLKRHHAELSAKARLDRQRAYSSSGELSPMASTPSAASAKIDDPTVTASVVAPQSPCVDESFTAGDSAAAAARAAARRQSPAGSLEVPTRVHAGQLMRTEDGQFICRICLDLCEDPVVLRCSHLFCRECLRRLVDWSTTRKEVQCPACRAPFSRDQVPEEQPLASALIGHIQICCAFADQGKLPDRDDDPLPEGHAARKGGLRCDWVGTVAAYAAHLELSCEVAMQLRELQRPGSGASSTIGEAGAGGGCGTPTGRFGAAAGRGGAGVPGRAAGTVTVGMAPGAPSIAATSLWCSTSASVGPTAGVRGPTASATLGAIVGAAAASTAVQPSEEAARPAAATASVAGETVAPGGRVMVVARSWQPTAADSQQLPLEAGMRVAVYHQEGRGWAYGARLLAESASGPSGWFPAWVLDPA